MLTSAVTFAQVILALHILSVVIAFGVVFAYPLFMTVGARLDPTAMPWFHTMQQVVSRWLVGPGLLLVVIFGVILASKFHAWHAFYVQWGIGAAIVIGAIEGAFMIPRTGRLAELARRDLEAGGLSGEYRAVFHQVGLGAGVVSLLVLVTVVLMTFHTGS